ncbi:hypothetical protein ACGF5M_02505 [Gemmatimonadota bacterium]
MFLLTRSRKRSLKHLEWRVRLFGAGALLALVGIAVQLPWLIYTAIVVLVAGMALRFLEEPLEEAPGKGSEPDPREEESESEGDPETL